ncbi:FAD-dependent oxidoreductase [Lysinibacter cavernae]|uniref:Thioredoxin reductase n=1 Tax=Lysinibacter cavernae TaxID=1640652 RepID=A0A7X5QZE9_9MICO|nr:FAD-dependent oxidoreductase [Lysinibacter cavernae]NIH52774.1 thioredoxin reductase [Lysinibacter cavernae]
MTLAAQQLRQLPIAVIGAGPIGLAAAAQAHERGLDVIVFEAGDHAGAAVASWGHTRLFSPWEFLVDAAAARLLDASDWDAPVATRIPHGRDLVESYLIPLSNTPELKPVIQYRSTVIAVSRQGMDKTRSAGREHAPFVLRVQTPTGTSSVAASAVIDTSGTYGTPNNLLSSGLEPTNNAAVRRFITGALPDVLGVDRHRFVGQHTVVVGAGHSAANTLLKLAELAATEANTRISWVIRSRTPQRVYGSAADELPARGELGGMVNALVDSGRVTLIDSYEIDNIVADASASGVVLNGRRAGEPYSVAANVVVNATGFRPNLDFLREIRLSLDEVIEAPRMLAPLIDPNMHSCGTVYPHGVDELAHPEPNFFIAGMKSYGRAPTFLLATGYEQVRSIADELAGNHAAARQVQLVLPETGVCMTVAPTADCSGEGAVNDSGDCSVDAATTAGSCGRETSALI